MFSRIERQGALAETEAVDLIVQVARGLHEAHKQGIIHRDVKPDNILLTRDGQAKLTDLGLSKDLEENLDLTRPDKGLGTPNFIAPEQFGDAKNAGVRCDIYSLGATLYMALTGELPFAGDGLASIMRLKMSDNVQSPRQRVPSVSEHVDFAVRRALQVDPERRFGSCPEFIAALAGETNAPVGRPPSPNGASLRRPRKSTGAKGKERRAAVRYECALPTRCTVYLSLHEEETDSIAQWDAQVCDLSVLGIGLLVVRRFEPGSELEVVLSSSDGVTSLTRRMHAVRVERADSRRWFIGGPLTERLTKEELRSLL
jgi:serine/threonine protein kinase